MKLIPGSQPMYCKTRKIPLALHNRFKEKLETIVRQSIQEPLQPGGFTNASPIIWQRKEIGVLRLSFVLKVHINCKIMDEDYPIPDMETIVKISKGPPNLAKFTYQTDIIKSKGTRMQKKYLQLTHCKVCSRCASFLGA